MTRVDRVDIDRVVLRGVATAGLEGPTLRALVEAAIAARLVETPLPAGRTVRAAVHVTAARGAPMSGPVHIARAVADGVVSVVGGAGSARG